MSEISQKMQQRAQIIAILEKYTKGDSVAANILYKDIKTVKNFDDQFLSAKIFLKEINDVKSYYSSICAIFLLEAVEKNAFEKAAIEYLEDKKNSDEKKFYTISLIKQKGIKFDFEDIAKYIQTPENIAQNGVKDFLLNALCDPEVQLDLLDFYLNIPKDEKLYFLNSLNEEFEGDDLANALSLIAKLEIDDDELSLIIAGLINSKSPFALEGLSYLINNREFDKITSSKIKKTIKELSFKYPNFENNEIIKNSTLDKCYIGFVDGKSNFSFVLTRKRDDNSIDTILLSINILKGITSCMGFHKIREQNFNTIIKRLYNDSMPVEIPSDAFRGLFEYYFKKNAKTRTKLPYELIVWQKLIQDTDTINGDISEFLNSKLKTIKLSQTRVKKFIMSPVIEPWYYSLGQNEYVDEIIEEIETVHTTDINRINEIVSNLIDKNFLNNKQFIADLQSMLLIQAYIAHLANLKITSSIAYSLCFKNPFLKLFITSSIDKSIYYYLSNRLFECEDKKNKSNFKKIKIETNYKKEELELLMEKLEAKWS